VSAAEHDAWGPEARAAKRARRTAHSHALAGGITNRFDFLTPNVNQKVAANEFTFKPPAGTQIIKP
jgi:hypothetical protein